MTTTRTARSEAPRLAQESKNGWLQVTPGERFIIRTSSDDTDGAYTTIEVAADPGNGVRMHIHQNEEEHVIILEGTARVACGYRTWDAAAGTSFTVGRGVPHAWCNPSESSLRMLVTFSPGRIEGLFQAVAQGNPDLAALMEDFGVRIVGPTLIEGRYTISSPRS